MIKYYFQVLSQFLYSLGDVAMVAEIEVRGVMVVYKW